MVPVASIITPRGAKPRYGIVGSIRYWLARAGSCGIIPHLIIMFAIAAATRSRTSCRIAGLGAAFGSSAAQPALADQLADVGAGQPFLDTIMSDISTNPFGRAIEHRILLSGGGRD